jgi:transcription antitermination factor NusG
MESWFVLSTKPQKEFHIERLFQEGGFKVYCPRFKDAGRIKPFFPCYEFVYFSYPDQYKLVKYTRGVRHVVGNEGGAIPLNAQFIDELRAREVGGFIELEKYGLEPSLGDEIEVVTGPWKGLRGVFQKQMSDQDRVMILLNYVSYQGQLLIEKSKLKKVLP